MVLILWGLKAYYKNRWSLRNKVIVQCTFSLHGIDTAISVIAVLNKVDEHKLSNVDKESKQGG